MRTITHGKIVVPTVVNKGARKPAQGDKESLEFLGAKAFQGLEIDVRVRLLNQSGGCLLLRKLLRTSAYLVIMSN